jgi:hypothetical protein
MGALPGYSLYFLGGILYLNSHVIEILKTFRKIFFGPGEFQDHNTFSLGQNSGIEYIEGEIMVFNQIADNGFFSYGFGKF